jgi:ubiquinone/menaquinone biosynthesis C-methylase UbiE
VDEAVKVERPKAQGPGMREAMTDAMFTAEAQVWSEMYERLQLRAVIHQRRLRLALRFVDGLSLPPNTKVLEVGCGAGIMATALAHRGASVVAVDRVEAMLAHARDRAKGAGVADRVHLARSDAASLPFESGTFRLVVGLGLLMWVPSPEAAALEMSRILEPGGFILLSASNRWRLNHVLDPLETPLLASLKPLVKAMLRMLKLRKARERPGSLGHSIKEFDQLIRRAGLEPVASSTFGFGPFTLFRRKLLPKRLALVVDSWFQRLADKRVPGLRSAGAQYVVLARLNTS